VQARGLDEFAFLTSASGPAPDFEGFEAVGERPYVWLGVPWRVITYHRAAPRETPTEQPFVRLGAPICSRGGSTGHPGCS
jgi:hypothetical protein